jgi:hypothetical protein
VCYEQWSLSIGNGDFQHLTEQKPLNRSIQKFEHLITSAWPLSWPRFIMIGRGVSAPHIGEIYGSRSSFFRWLVGQTHSRPRAFEPHMLYISRRGSGQEGAFWGSHRYVSSHREVIPQNPSFLGTSMGIPSLNVYRRMCDSKNWEIGLLQGSNLQKFISKANLQPNFKSTANDE